MDDKNRNKGLADDHEGDFILNESATSVSIPDIVEGEGAESTGETTESTEDPTPEEEEEMARS